MWGAGADLGAPRAAGGKEEAAQMWGDLWAQPGKVKAFHTGSFPFRWRRMQSHCLKMGAWGVGFEIQNTQGSGTRELLRGPRGGPGGSESLALGRPDWTPEHAGNLTSHYAGKWAFLSAS